MKQLNLDRLGKRYSKRWIFRNLTRQFETGARTAILGRNGAGKSTLLQILAGFVSPSEGRIIFNGTDLQSESVSFSAPYMDLPGVLTLHEILDFYFRFKKIQSGCSPSELLEECDLLAALHAPLKELSSGMEQKAKLVLTFLTDAHIYLFDEPCSHLDEPSIGWFNYRMNLLPSDALVFIGSNNEEAETRSCNNPAIKLS